MVPRTEVTAIPIDATLDSVMPMASDTFRTRLPIYDGDTDHIGGIIKVKRLMPLFLDQIANRAIVQTAEVAVAAHGADRTVAPGIEARTLADEREKTFDIRHYMMEPMLVPETLAASEVPTRMRENSIQVAVASDEYGGAAGTATLQVIATHLIGCIEELDDASQPNGETPDGILHLDSLTGFVELRERYNIDLLNDGYDVETLGGYVFFVLGRPIIVNDEVIESDGQQFVVEALEGLRVVRV
jgi:putative hemolysin